MIELKCKHCGAPLKSIGFNKYICEYCGNLYQEDNFGNIVVIEVGQYKSETLVAECRVPYHIKDKMATEYSLERLKHQLADGLTAFMKIRTKEDPSTNCTIIRGEVRVIPPNFLV